MPAVRGVVPHGDTGSRLLGMASQIRNDAPDAVFHVTARVNWRYWHLQPEFAVEVFHEVLDRCLDEFGVDLVGGAVMSNHCHLVPRSPEPGLFETLTTRIARCRHRYPYPKGHLKSSVLSQFMHKLMLLTSRRIQKELGLSGRFWERRFHSRRVIDKQDLIRTVAYDHLNPVVQGMVDRPEEYRRSSAAWWAGTGSSRMRLVRRPLPFSLDTQRFRDELLRHQNNRQFLLAAKEFEADRGYPLTQRGWRDFCHLLDERAGETARSKLYLPGQP